HIFINSAGFRLDHIVIYQIIDGVFFSNLVLKNGLTDEDMILDARTSDAVAMAVRFDAPVYTTEQVLSEAGILLEIEEADSGFATNDPFEEDATGLSSLSTEELQAKLDAAVKEEDFDQALEIQQEIKKRKKNID
ncbi:MAG: bifunctional nuclease family protein, partial [Chryseobacterium sp.]